MSLFRKASLFLAVVMLTAACSGCYFFPREEEVLAPPLKVPDKVEYDTIEVKKGDIENKITCTGAFVSVSQNDHFYKDRGGRLQSVKVRLGDEVKKGDLLAELETDTILNDIQLQEIALKRAKLVYDNAKTRYDIEGGSKSEMEMALFDVESNQIRLDSLKKEYERTKLTAAIDGEVVYITDIKLGEYVNAYTTIVRVADPTQLQLRYSGDKVNNFKLGMKATIDMDKKQYPAEVVMTPSEVPDDASEEAKKSVQLKVDNLPKDATIGQTAMISLTLEKRSGVIVLPRQVINNFGARRFVNVLKNNIREERDIETGVESSTQVEVLSGLDEGELVIVK
ncbi:MAG TPA: efflux RND transporter periplasmic adaptor subunit [Clostridia bacterium]|nr:efflux RND transporter periplasmic adaptor subunit [Clostridia bacterium]